ncbi:MAG: hypothetical protein BMS9Abin36_0781 [Gammaproteobacteria bacterium]|nr:MAG: hypothetical protein BMS9Abin36_0781 [Gammaproteobacteria bacterium]
MLPMDMEWAKDGIDGELYLVQARPETVAVRESKHVIKEYRLTEKSEIRISGRAVGRKIAAGKVCMITDVGTLHEFRPGEVLVADITTPDWEPVMKTAAAIVTNRGGRTCHAAIVARELGIPAVVGTRDATECLRNGEAVTVSCAEGEEGHIYDGSLSYEIDELDVSKLKPAPIKIMVNIGNPEQAFQVSRLPCEGVRLARMEFIINEAIKIHPMALLHPQRLNESDRAQIAEVTGAYARPQDFFVQGLAEGVGTIAAAFYPRPVIVRLSDFKSNEYAGLFGGAVFEPEEENPMIGFRGAARYIHPDYAEAFALECEALRVVREVMGMDNIIPMVPFCRTPEEGRQVLASMAKQGLKQGDKGLQIYMMCELPSNVLLLAEFAELFDGFSIGSNDLTQLVLGVDRDSALLPRDFDERNPAVIKFLEMAIHEARRLGKYIGICGQAPSDYPQLAERLVKAGIDSISLNPDSVLPVTLKLTGMETSSQ